MGTQQQFGKVHHAAAPTRLLIGLIDAHQLCLHRIALSVDMFGAQPFVLAGVDEPLRLLRRPVGFIELQLAQHTAHHSVLIVGVEDLKALGQTGLVPVLAQQAVGDAVEGAHPHAAGGHLQQGFDTPAHLPCGLVGKGHRENAEGRDAFGPNQPGDAVRKHPGLTAAGTGEDQQITGRSTDCLALGLVQGVNEIGNVHGADGIRGGQRG